MVDSYASNTWKRRSRPLTDVDPALGLLLLAGALTPALDAFPSASFVLQAGAIGGAFGLVVALRAHHRDPRADHWQITTAWSLVGLTIGVLAVLAEAVG